MAMICLSCLRDGETGKSTQHIVKCARCTLMQICRDVSEEQPHHPVLPEEVPPLPCECAASTEELLKELLRRFDQGLFVGIEATTNPQAPTPLVVVTADEIVALGLLEVAKAYLLESKPSMVVDRL